MPNSLQSREREGEGGRGGEGGREGGREGREGGRGGRERDGERGKGEYKKGEDIFTSMSNFSHVNKLQEGQFPVLSPYSPHCMGLTRIPYLEIEGVR